GRRQPHPTFRHVPQKLCEIKRICPLSTSRTTRASVQITLRQRFLPTYLLCSTPHGNRTWDRHWPELAAYLFNFRWVKSLFRRRRNHHQETLMSNFHRPSAVTSSRRCSLSKRSPCIQPWQEPPGWRA